MLHQKKAVFGFLRLDQGRLLFFGQDLQSEVLGGVAIFFNGPVAVLVVKRDPVVLNVFIKLNVADFETRNDSVQLFHDPRAQDLVDKEKHKDEEKGPGRRLIKVLVENAIDSVVVDRWGDHSVLGVQVLIGKHLLV